MANFDDAELIRGSESPDQAALKFLCGASSRLVHATEEQSKKCASMEATLMEIKNTLRQISNQLGIRPIDDEFSQQVPPVTYFSDPYVRDDVNRLPLDIRKSLSHRIEMPEFDGSNASDWLSKVERFFRVGRYSDLDKLDLVAFSFEGDVLRWFNWEMTRREFRSWDEFRRRLLLRFGAAREESTGNRLFAIKQTGTVSASVTELEELSVLEQQPVYKEESITQNKVPVSSLEPGLSFSCESLVVSDARQSDIVSNNWVHSQSVLECVKNKANAYQVFDKASLHKERLKPKNKRKLSLSLKTWMFKFKNKNLQRQYSCSRATFGYKWKEHNSRYWRRIRQTHLSRLRISQTNAEKALGTLKEIQSQQATVMRDGTKVSSLPAKELVPGDIVELRVGDKVPADMRMLVLISSTLRVEQGSLTGESETVSNTTKPVDVNADIQGKNCMVFAGTIRICSDKTGTLTTNQMAVSKLVAMGSRIGTLRSDQLWSELEQRIATLEFDRDRKSMGVLVDSSSGNKFLLVKGAVENVLDRSTRIQQLTGSVQELVQYSRDLTNTPDCRWYALLVGYIHLVYKFMKRKFCKDWWFKFKYNIRIGEALRLWNHLIQDSQLQ